MEQNLMLWVHAHANSFWNAFFYSSHLLGAAKFWAGLAAVGAIFYAVRGERTWTAVWAGLGGSTLIIVEGLKHAVGRVRPHLWTWPYDAKGASFPSGHATASITFYPLIAVCVSRAYPKLRTPALIAAALLVFEIGAGRVYDGVHWPTDILAGWVLGAAQLILALKLARTQEERR